MFSLFFYCKLAHIRTHTAPVTLCDLSMEFCLVVKVTCFYLYFLQIIYFIFLYSRFKREGVNCSTLACLSHFFSNYKLQTHFLMMSYFGMQFSNKSDVNYLLSDDFVYCKPKCLNNFSPKNPQQLFIVDDWNCNTLLLRYVVSYVGIHFCTNQFNHDKVFVLFWLYIFQQIFVKNFLGTF